MKCKFPVTPPRSTTPCGSTACATVNAGLLLFADDQTGEVRWTDKSGEAKSLTLGPHMISIQKAGR